jgi:DNA-binding IclR family transcriptional regulator
LQKTKWASGRTEKQLSARANRYMRLLRDHGIIKKLPEQNKYQMTIRWIKVANILNAFLAA